LPSTLLEAVKVLYTQVEQGAEARIEQAQTDFVAAREELAKALAAAEKQVAALTVRQDELTQQLATAQAQNQALNQALVDAEKREIKRETQLAAVTMQVDELKAALAEARQENRDIRAHFEHYQQRIAEDRQREREDARAMTQQLQDQLKRVTTQVKLAERALVDSQAAHRQDQEQVVELQNEVQELKNTVELKAQDIARLTHQGHMAEKENKALTGQQQELQRLVNTLTAEHAAAKQELVGLQQALEKADTARAKAMDSLTLLEEKNKQLIEEKAMVQGQLLQLQGSMVGKS
jgi:chromosome segregation ATPase